MNDQHCLKSRNFKCEEYKPILDFLSADHKNNGANILVLNRAATRVVDKIIQKFYH
jgi:hypothetical protein